MRVILLKIFGFVFICVSFVLQAAGAPLKYPVAGTGQTEFYSDREVVKKPSRGDDFWGQDACFAGTRPRYKDNKNGTVTDLVTGLTWEKNMGEKMTFAEAEKKAKCLKKGGYRDWRIPTIKELYSLIQFTGRSMGERAGTLYIDTKYFDQPLGDVSKGEREIDAQTWSSTFYTGKTMGGQTTIFGVNFIDGRIKGYPLVNMRRREDNKMYFRMVRGNADYGKNKFVDNHDGTISDLATGLMWQKSDDGNLYDWRQALAYAEKLKLAGYSDWRLPNAKELQSIVDYTRSPEKTQSPALSPLFECSTHRLCGGIKDYAYYWSSTTHLDGPNSATQAVCVCFGNAWGKSPRTGEITDVHGAGAVRSDPKSGAPENYPVFVGPQKDMRCVFNAVRCVRTIHGGNTRRGK